MSCSPRPVVFTHNKQTQMIIPVLSAPVGFEKSLHNVRMSSSEELFTGLFTDWETSENQHTPLSLHTSSRRVFH